ncbi:MAG: hypothetical protein KAV87_04780, partial [Desulfobacteraceae bacterium]|nr:hypothetical protein [Desulfobacteraceae bacterium]
MVKTTKEDDTVHVSLDKRQSSSGILDIIDTRIYTRPDVVEISNKYRRNRLLERVKKSVAPGFQDQLEAMNRELEFIGASEEFKVEVDVTTDKLQEIPEEAISSIKISTVIRNYTWSQVEQEGAKVIRRLVPA